MRFVIRRYQVRHHRIDGEVFPVSLETVPNLLQPPQGLQSQTHPPPTFTRHQLSIVLCVPINLITRDNLMLSGEMVIFEYVEPVEFPVDIAKIRN